MSINFYVAKILSKSYKELKRGSMIDILSRGGFQLNKWHSNQKDDETVRDMKLGNSAETSALGITWDQQKDLFIFSLSSKEQVFKKFTKRTILSLSSSLFDSLGFLAPLIIKAKIIMQELWILKVGWNESIPHELHTACENFVLDINEQTSPRIPRFCLVSEFESFQIHGFCDASIRPVPEMLLSDFLLSNRELLSRKENRYPN